MLIGRLRYLEDELVDLPYDDVADEHVPDKIEDVRPFIYKAKEDDDDPGDNDEVQPCSPAVGFSCVPPCVLPPSPPPAWFLFGALVCKPLD